MTILYLILIPVVLIYLGIGFFCAFILTDGISYPGRAWKTVKLVLFRISIVFFWLIYLFFVLGASLKGDKKKQLEEEIIWKNYDPEQCPRRIWNEEEKTWERGFSSCSVCSSMCPQRAKDFERLGKKEYVDKETGLGYWK